MQVQDEIELNERKAVAESRLSNFLLAELNFKNAVLTKYTPDMVTFKLGEMVIQVPTSILTKIMQQ